jgi:hypothetical protein
MYTACVCTCNLRQQDAPLDVGAEDSGTGSVTGVVGGVQGTIGKSLPVM